MIILSEIEQLWQSRKENILARIKDDLEFWKMFDCNVVKKQNRFLDMASRIDKRLDDLIIFDFFEEAKKYAETGLKYITEAEDYGCRKLSTNKIGVDEAKYLYVFYRYRFKWVIDFCDDEYLARDAMNILWSIIDEKVARKDFKHILYSYTECVYLAIKCKNYIIAQKCLEYMRSKEKKINNASIVCSQSAFLQKIVDFLVKKDFESSDVKLLFDEFYKNITKDIGMFGVYGQYATDVAFIYFKYFCKDHERFNPVNVTKSIKDGID